GIGAGLHPESFSDFARSHTWEKLHVVQSHWESQTIALRSPRGAAFRHQQFWHAR
ncbi:hypothetical protein KI387_033864, partial [Taxus chinensis]